MWEELHNFQKVWKKGKERKNFFEIFKKILKILKKFFKVLIFDNSSFW